MMDAVQTWLRLTLGMLVRRFLRNYAPDRQGTPTQTVLEKAEVLCEDWAA
jgi:hypothetical protein